MEEKKIAMLSYRCSKCRPDNIGRDGSRSCKKRGRVKRHKCYSCKYIFSGSPGFEEVPLPSVGHNRSPDDLRFWHLAGVHIKDL